MPINVFEPKSQFIAQRKQIIKAVEKVFNSGNYILGEEVKKLERSFSKIHGTKFGIAVKNGTDALTIALRVLGIGKGDEVITTSHTALATIASIIDVGAKPVIVDIEKFYYTINPVMIKKAITRKTKAIIPVHIYGQSCDIFQIKKIAKQNNINLIEDCSQSHGGKIKNKSLGSFGQLSTFSFYPTKNVGAIGDGGIILTNKKSLQKKLIRFREYGWDKRRITNKPGINSRLDELQAAILNVKLKKFEKSKHKRVQIANKYLSKIKNQNILLPKIRCNTTHVFHIFAVMVKNRKKFINYLNSKNIFPGIHYLKLAHLNLGYKRYCKFKSYELINSKYVSKSTVSLPIYPELSLKTVDKIIHIINKYK